VTPALLLESVNEGDFAGLIFGEKFLHVGDRQKSGNHLLFFTKARDVHRLMYEPQMDAGFITAHGGVERRLAVEEVDCKSELVAIEIGRYTHIRDIKHWHCLRQL